jgi:hypothetical protein
MEVIHMKRFTSALLIAVVMLGLMATTVFAIQGYVIGATIYGGQTANKVGFARIWNDADSLNIEIMMRGGAGWCMSEFMVHVGATLEDFPINAGGNLIPGHFDYKPELAGDCVRGHLLEIPLADLAARGITPGDEFFMAIHIVAFNRYTGQEETGWTVRCGDLWGQQFPGDPGWEGYVRFTTDAWYLFP